MTFEQRDVHGLHEDERSRSKRETRAKADGAREANELWQRRLLPLLANDVPVETDFGGCFG